MTEELFSVLFNYVYAPFLAAAGISAGFFWRLREKDKDSTVKELTLIDRRLSATVTHDNIKKMIEIRVEPLNLANEAQIKMLHEISSTITRSNIIQARIDERVKSIENKLTLIRG